MPQVEVSLPDQVDTEIDRLVDQGEFINRDQAIEDLLARGISAYAPTDESASTFEEDVFSQTISDQQDPALQSDSQRDQHSF